MTYGTIILHVSPEAADGGPLALVRDGDVFLSVSERRFDLLVPEEERRRRAQWKAVDTEPPRQLSSTKITFFRRRTGAISIFSELFGGYTFAV